MGILSKGVTKLLKPEPSYVGPSGGPSKKVRNPITKPRTTTTQTINRDIDFETEDRISIEDGFYGDADYEEVRGEEYVIPKKIGEFYSPVRDTIEQMPIAKDGSTGQTIEAFLNKRSPSVTKSELANTRIKLNPTKKYLREEILALQNIPEGYDIRVRSKKDGNVLFSGEQRQPVLDRPENYFEVTIHTPKIDPDVEQITKGHFPTGTVAHVRASRRRGEDGEGYILIEEVQSDAARAAGQKYDPIEGGATEQESYEFDEAFGHSISMENVMDEEIVEDIARENKIKWMNDDYEQAISEAITNYSTGRDPKLNPFYSTTRRFYRDVHKRYNDPNLYNVQMETPEGVAYLKMQDEALRLDMQGEDIPAAYNEPYMRLAENLISEYSMYFPSLQKDTKFNIYNFQDRSDTENVKLIPDGIRKIHAYAIKKDGQDFINKRLPEEAADFLKKGTYEYDANDFKKKLQDGTVQKYLLEDSPDPFLKSESTEKIIQNVEDSIYTKIAPEDIPLGGEVYSKEQVPITTKTETMLKGLQASIALAKEQGLDKIVIPSYRQFDKTRGYGDPSADESAFRDLYDQAFKKAFNILKTDSKGTIKLNTKKIKIAKDGSSPSSYIDSMAHYGGRDFYEDFAYEIDISNFEFDPEKQAFRFSKGGTLMDSQMELFNEGGLRDEGGQVEPKSGNKVPSGSLKEEVADDIPVMISEGEFVFPADVVRYIGLQTLMKMRQDAKQGLKMMEEMGQMGNSEEATIPDDVPFGMADLIVVSGEMKKKNTEEKAQGGVVGLANGGSLFNDPRFQRPEGGDTTPVLSEDDKEKITDGLLRTGFGNVVMKRYVNADGDVQYIPFVNGVPQMDIPEGYELDEAAPRTESNIGGSGDSRGDDGGSSSSPVDVSPFEPSEQPTPKGPVVDGVEYKTIEEMDTETLVKYYKQFDSPIYRYAATGAALLFSPLAGLAIMVGQTLSNKNSPTGLTAVQTLLQSRSLTEAQRKSVLETAESLRKNGSGGVGSLGKKLLQGIGILSNKEQGEELTDFEKAIKSGNTADAINAAGGAVSNNQNAFNKAVLNKEYQLKEFMFDYGYKSKAEDIQGPPTAPEFPDQLGEQEFGFFGEEPEPQPLGLPVELGEQEFGFEDTAAVNQAERASVDFLEPQRGIGGIDRDPRLDFNNINPNLTKPIIEQPDFYEGYFKEGEELGRDAIRRITPDDPIPKGVELSDPEARTPPDPEEIMQPKKKKVTKPPIIRSDDDDRDDGGPSGIDDFVGVDFGVQPQPDPYQPPSYDDLGGSPFDNTGPAPAPPPSAPPTYDYDQTGPFYVGGVATKPMKPQRLKKGGLAKPKVKPKRMKKGGLASKKK